MARAVKNWPNFAGFFYLVPNILYAVVGEMISPVWSLYSLNREIIFQKKKTIVFDSCIACEFAFHQATLDNKWISMKGYNSGQNSWNNVKKSNKTGQDEKIWYLYIWYTSTQIIFGRETEY